MIEGRKAAGEGLPLAWERLVTDGHVRAARVRWMQPWLILLAVLAILLGFYMAAATASRRGSAEGAPSSGVVESQRLQRPVASALRHLPKLNVSQNEGNTLPLFSAIASDVIPPLLTELNSSGRLGAREIPVKVISVEDFWRKDWPHGANLVGTGTGDVRLVGAVANRYGVQYVSGARWLGVFRRKNGKWSVVSATDGDFYAPSGPPSTSLLNIPLTLRPVLPAPVTADEEQGDQ